MDSQCPPHPSRRIAVVGSGIAGLGAAWLLARSRDVTLFEQAATLGGHSNTVDVPDGERLVPVDTGFIVYNVLNYPNLVALFEKLRVPTVASDMSFAVSLGDGALEYSGTNLRGLFAQPVNAVRPRFWRMLADLRRFYREAPRYLGDPGDPLSAQVSIGELLDAHGYSAAFCEDHLWPMAGAIWSATARDIRAYPARAFIEFFANHGLLQLGDRPQWRTVVGGAREYVRRLRDALSGAEIRHQQVVRIERQPSQVLLHTRDGAAHTFDQVVIATHADQALALLAAPSPLEVRLLGAFRYSRNVAYLHEDARWMPRRRAAWASWNYLSPSAGDGAAPLCVSYWMNNLQPLGTPRPYFVTLNPPQEPAPALTHYRTLYEHPQFDTAALTAQRALWQLQGRQRTWFCGSYFGYGFHEDALQAGLAVAEQLGGHVRPWPATQQRSRVPTASPPALHEVA